MFHHLNKQNYIINFPSRISLKLYYTYICIISISNTLFLILNENIIFIVRIGMYYTYYLAFSDSYDNSISQIFQ